MRDEKKTRAASREGLRPRKRKPYIGPAALFFIALALVTALAWCLPLRPAVSQKEKRELERFPAFSLTALGDGSYFEQIGVWFSDTFPGRDLWIEAAQSIERLHGSSDIVIYGDTETSQAVPVAVPTAAPTPEPSASTPAPTAAPVQTAAGEETTAEPETTEEPGQTPVPEPEEDEEPAWGGVVIEEEDLVTTGAVIQIGDRVFEYSYFSQYYCDRYAANMNRAAQLLAGKCRVFSVFLLKSTTLLLPRDYRDQIGCAPEEDILEYVNSQLVDAVGIDTYNSLLPHNGEYIYFRTDHHWTALGAWYVYAEWARQAGFEPVGLDQYREIVQEPFYGSLFYKANQSNRLVPDTVYAYEPPGDVHLFLELNGKDSLTNRGFENDLVTIVKASSTDKYMCFLAGDHPLCTFINNDITDGSACLIVKNSQGNPFCYYFTQHYQYVYVIDYRKYNRRSLTGFVDYYDIDDVVFCFSSGQAQSNGGNQLITQFVR
ncbi:MAG: hypothetical protein IKQ10_01140 [Oscillospiraceae bacterium]|nr:hypothetical protein [Oscillospiraceae bacterium]